MDILSYYYFTELCKDLNMNRTAERLYVSQQTISNHIQRLEEHYGTRLFYRKPTLSLTYAGEYALQFSQRLLREQLNLEEFLNDVEKKGKGVLHFGASSLRLNDSLPQILPAFTARYPEIELKITSAFSSRLEPLVLEGKLDLAIVLDSTRPNPVLEQLDFAEDQVFACLPEKLLLDKGKDAAWKEKALSGLEVTECADLPFCLTENRIGESILQAYFNAGLAPQVYLSSSDTNLSFAVCCKGVAGAFIGQNRLANAGNALPDDLNIFPLTIGGKPVVQKLIMIRRKDRYASEAVKYFMQLLQESAGEMERVSIARSV